MRGAPPGLPLCLLLVACDWAAPGATSPSDDLGGPAPRDDGPSAPAPPRQGCDPGAYVDCFGGSPTCAGGVVRVPIYRPIPYCTHEEAQAAYQSGICQRSAGTMRCPSGECAAPDPRFADCLRNGRRPSPYAWMLCEGAVHREGDACGEPRDCVPSAPLGDLRLDCDLDAGRCVAAPREADGGVLHRPCTYDEDCAPGLDCVIDRDCRGACRLREGVAADGG